MGSIVLGRGHPVAVLAVAAVFVGVVPGVPGAGAGPSPSTSGAPAAKCRTVVKVVKGKRKRVRVCPKPPTRPRNVTLRLDRAHAASATIGAAGGTVSATERDGTRYTVALPAGALTEEATITVTPVTSLSGIAKVRLLAGVELGPDGTALTKPATITVTLPRNAKAVFGVAWLGTGRNASQYPIGRRGTRATIRVAHFSGVGVATGDPNLVPTLETHLTVAYAREVRPLLRRAVTDDTAFAEAVNAAASWLRSTELWGLQSRFATFRREALALLEQVFRNALEKASERCRNHDLTQLDRIAAIGRKGEGLGFDLGALTPFERIARCAHFELSMDFDWVASTDSQTSGGSTSIRDSLHVRAPSVPILMNTENVQMEGEGALEPTAWHETFSVTSEDYSCTLESNGPATPRDPMRVILTLDVSKSPTGVFLDIDPGDVTTPRSPGCLAGSNPPAPPVYQGAWDALYQARKRPDGRFRFELTDVLGQEIVATLGPDTISGSYTTPANASWSGTLQLVLRHTPAG